MKTKRIILWVIGCVLLVGLLLVVTIRLSNFYPPDIQSEDVICRDNAPILQSGQTIKVLNWNVQYMAGKGYVFFYDLPDDSGPDTRPSSESIARTITEVARVIKAENPDIILLQELDDNSKRTDYQDQLEKLLALLSSEYQCNVSAFYHQSLFVPHPKIMGRVAMKETIISKYQIASAQRYQLELIPVDILTKQFNFKRAVLEATLPVDGSKDIKILTTHLDAFAQGTDALEKQVNQVNDIMQSNVNQGYPTLIGGDFNLLPPGNEAYNRLGSIEQSYYNPDSEISTMFDNYQSVPSINNTNGDKYQDWFTHFPNNPDILQPDRTIDYYFLSRNISIQNSYVRNNDTLNISDHLPLVMEINIP